MSDNQKQEKSQIPSVVPSLADLIDSKKLSNVIEQIKDEKERKKVLEAIEKTINDLNKMIVEPLFSRLSKEHSNLLELAKEKKK